MIGHSLPLLRVWHDFWINQPSAQQRKSLNVLTHIKVYGENSLQIVIRLGIALTQWRLGFLCVW